MFISRVSSISFMALFAFLLMSCIVQAPDQTYSSSRQGITLTYPPAWQVSEEEGRLIVEAEGNFIIIDNKGTDLNPSSTVIENLADAIKHPFGITNTNAITITSSPQMTELNGRVAASAELLLALPAWAHFSAQNAPATLRIGTPPEVVEGGLAKVVYEMPYSVTIVDLGGRKVAVYGLGLNVESPAYNDMPQIIESISFKSRP